MICKEQLTSVLINNHQLLHLTSSKRWLRCWMRTRVPTLQPLNPLMPDKGEEAHIIHQRDGWCSISQIQNHSAQCHSALRRGRQGQKGPGSPPRFSPLILQWVNRNILSHHQQSLLHVQSHTSHSQELQMGGAELATVHYSGDRAQCPPLCRLHVRKRNWTYLQSRARTGGFGKAESGFSLMPPHPHLASKRIIFWLECKEWRLQVQRPKLQVSLFFTNEGSGQA